MNKEEMKKRAKKNLVNLDKLLNALQKGIKAAELLRAHAVKRQLHKRAIASTKALDGLYVLVSELQEGKSLALEILDAKHVPVIDLNKEERHLKLVVNNEKGGK